MKKEYSVGLDRRVTQDPGLPGYEGGFWMSTLIANEISFENQLVKIWCGVEQSGSSSGS
jgi:hypothetical protein